MRLIVARSSLSPLTKWSGCQKLKLQIFGTLFVSGEVEAHTHTHMTHTLCELPRTRHLHASSRMSTRTTTLSWHLSNLSRRRLLTAICCLDAGSVRFISFHFQFSSVRFVSFFGFVCCPQEIFAFWPVCCLTNEEVFFRIC